MPKYPLRGGAVSRLPAHLARSALALGIALALPVGVLHAQEQAAAENADSSTTDESAPVELDAVQVQGIRASVMRAQDIKRDADTFVDSVTALDIGSSKVSALIAERNEDGEPLTVLGTGQRESRGVRRGCIADMGATEVAVREAVVGNVTSIVSGHAPVCVEPL